MSAPRRRRAPAEPAPILPARRVGPAVHVTAGSGGPPDLVQLACGAFYAFGDLLRRRLDEVGR